MGSIEIENLHFTYPSRNTPTLRGIDARVNPKAFILLTGPTGCGKSTLLRTLNGLIPHASGGKLTGNVRVNGTGVSEQPIAVTCQQVGLLFQNPEEQLFCIIVEDEIAFGLENLGLSSHEIDRRIDSALAQVGLAGFRNRQIAALSSGQKQRVALACVCAMQPQILLLDEPTSYLDPQATHDILKIIRELNRKLGITVIVAGHQVNEIAPLCSRVWLMNDGKLVSNLPIDQAFTDLERYSQLGVQVPELAQVAEQLGYSERPLTLNHAAQLFVNSTPDSTQPRSHRDKLSSGLISSNASSTDPTPVPTQTTPSNPDSILAEVQNLSFRYPQTSVDVLKNISFQIKGGEVIAIMGANGSGKTTLLLHLIALLRPSEGQVFVKDQDTRRCKPRHLAGQVGIVFQNPDLLLQASTVSEEVAFGPKNFRLSRQEVEERLEEILLMFDLEILKAEAPYALSRGQRQRTAVAASFSLYPDLLLLDEPTTGQDYYHLQQLMQMLNNTTKAQNRTVIFCTHDARLTLEYASRVLLLHRGELIFDGTPDTAFANPERLEQASLVPPLTMQLQRPQNDKTSSSHENPPPRNR
ncbi:ABC transporter ATP-binding protein [Candidatus Poribacteria bacterium]|nr:MAG: ABC transporter ATP-binding protein [Candidatus Poribacteria bacterium]